MELKSCIQGCILGGAFGDSLGSGYEVSLGAEIVHSGSLRPSSFTDDTQLTVTTCESIVEKGKIDAHSIADNFLRHFVQGKLTGLGSSTLKSLRDLEAGLPWYSSGASGEKSAGNGAAMRIAPLAFLLDSEDPLNLKIIREVCSITHKNDEAFVGALAVIEMIWKLLRGVSSMEALSGLPETLPDTRVRDRLIELNEARDLTISQAAKKFGCSGYVMDSVPFAIFAASKVEFLGFSDVIDQVIRSGGDTDSNASIAGQLCGVVVGGEAIPFDKIRHLANADAVFQAVETFSEFVTQRK